MCVEHGKKKVAGLLTVDVKGVFDGVLRNRLISRLRSQGWRSSLTQWVFSFYSERQVRIRLDHDTTEPSPILCGLPQGSPVSPILFPLYVEPLLRLSRGRFGYADDAAFLSSGRTLKECQTKLQKQKQKSVEPPFQAGNVEITAKELIKCPGEYFDRKLSFREHIRLACQRSRAVTHHVRRISNTTRDASPSLLRQAVQGCAFATLFYAAETWYSPQTSQWALNQVQTAINWAARAVLPVYKTLPIPALLRETGWGPVNAWLNRIHDRLAVRITASDPGHPLCHRWNSSHFAWIRRRQKLELSTDTYRPPWIQIDRESLALQVGASGRLNGLDSYERWARERNSLDLTVFSDGSVKKAGKAGAGC
ncbi:hypothetical protein K3495_g2707 [Podosphaera aphanis]|nr:hypothetical protein K3495_g2707 [Podosphaera aphanis]